jgi:hypothetical protein
MADTISQLTGVPTFRIDVANGQVETRAWLEAVANAVGVSPLGVPRKPQIAKKVVEALGGSWPANGFTGGQDGMSHLSSPGFNALCAAIENFYADES